LNVVVDEAVFALVENRADLVEVLAFVVETGGDVVVAAQDLVELGRLARLELDGFLLPNGLQPFEPPGEIRSLVGDVRLLLEALGLPAAALPLVVQAVQLHFVHAELLVLERLVRLHQRST